MITKGKILRQDTYVWDGTDKTATRRDATGGHVSGLKFGLEVDVLSAYGNGIDYTLQTINKAVINIGTDSVTLVFNPGTWVIDDDLTLASNYVIRVPAGCVFDVASGKTLTFSGPVIQDHATWTSGSGTVTTNGTRTINGSTSQTGDVTQTGNVTRTGTSSNTGDVTIIGDTTQTGDYALTGDMTISGTLTVGGASVPLPSGVITSYGGTSAPTGYLLCDGSAVSRTTYAALFAVVSTNFGLGDGSTTFNLPDLRGKYVVGYDGDYLLGATRMMGSNNYESVLTEQQLELRYIIKT